MTPLSLDGSSETKTWATSDIWIENSSNPTAVFSSLTTVVPTCVLTFSYILHSRMEDKHFLLLVLYSLGFTYNLKKNKKNIFNKGNTVMCFKATVISRKIRWHREWAREYLRQSFLGGWGVAWFIAWCWPDVPTSIEISGSFDVVGTFGWSTFLMQLFFFLFF